MNHLIPRKPQRTIMKKFKKPNRNSTPTAPGRGPKPARGQMSGVTRGPKPGRGPVRPQTPSRSAGPSRSALPSGRVVVGIHAVRELFSVRPSDVGQLWIRDNFEEHLQLVELHDVAVRSRIRIALQPVGALDRVTSNHQGVVAFAESEPTLNWASLKDKEFSTLLALDEVEDPHNLGAVLRTSWLLGAEAVLTPEHRAAQLSPAVSKVAQGAVEHVPVVRDGPLPQQLKELKDLGYWVIGLAHTAEKSIYEFEVPAKVVWVLGSEASGMRKSVEGVCDDLISIPQASPNASYNISVAAAIVIAETYRQRLKT